jgi:hypothetical protein
MGRSQGLLALTRRPRVAATDLSRTRRADDADDGEAWRWQGGMDRHGGVRRRGHAYGTRNNASVSARQAPLRLAGRVNPPSASCRHPFYTGIAETRWSERGRAKSRAPAAPGPRPSRRALRQRCDQGNHLRDGLPLRDSFIKDVEEPVPGCVRVQDGQARREREHLRPVRAPLPRNRPVAETA